ncbi:fused MFS/spermidine synthase [Paenibacillus macerans]|uniref:fused MFS/spermidine synthase n=1 Tax=Paenibacillus macerans TaxID=44252 RepID=UPI003D30EF8E
MWLRSMKWWRRFAGLFFDGAELQVRVGDGRRVLEEELPGIYDGIILDAFSEKGTPRHLVSRSFFRLAAERLHSGGLILLNVFGRGAGDGLVAAIATTLLEELDDVRVFSLPAEPPHELRNMIIAGSRRPISYQGRQMAGFVEVRPPEGYIIAEDEEE